jgi:hypothetical protein
MQRRTTATVVTLLTLLVAASGLYKLCYEPYMCAVIDHRLTIPTQRARENQSTFEGLSRARHNLVILEPALGRCRGEIRVRLLMLAGVNYDTISRHERAAVLYEEALQFDRRPELFLNLGLSKLAQGDRQSALNNLAMAADGGGLSMADYIPDGELRTAVYDRVGQWRDFLSARAGVSPKNLLENGDFDSDGGRHGSISKQPWPPEHWLTAGELEASHVTSVPGSGGAALRIIATSPGSGIYQVLPPIDPPVQKTVTTARIFVVSGKVYVGAGNDGIEPTAHSSGTGQWEQIRAINRACPRVSHVGILSASDSAEFYIAQVTTRQLTSVPCP